MPSAPPPATSCATSATDWSCPRATPRRWRARSGACTTIRGCGPAWERRDARTCAPTPRRPGRTASARRWTRRAGRGRLDTVTARCAGGPPSRTPSPHRLMRRVVLLTALLCLLAPASAVASKAGRQRLSKDCASDGEINGQYTQSDYKYALSHIPSDLAEYTNCADAIRQAQSAAAGHHGSGGGGTGGGGFTGGGLGGTTPGIAPTGGGALSPTDRSALAPARGNGSPVGIGGGAPVTPGGPGITASSVTPALPVPLLVVLILPRLGAAAGAGAAIRNRVVSGRQA